MTLKELKENVLKMIEEISDTPDVYTDDPDIDKKLNTIINQVMFEVARMKKIHAVETDKVKADDEYNLNGIKNFYQLDHIEYKTNSESALGFKLFGNIAIFPEDGNVRIYYYKYPTRITESTDDEKYKFELSSDALEVLPYGVAADLLKSDVSASYGQIYAQRYELMLQRLDSRYSQPMIEFESVGDLDGNWSW